MKIVNVCQHDWANFSFDNSQALRSVGVDCIAIKEHTHRFAYEAEGLVMRSNEIYNKIRHADIVQIFHSDKKYISHCTTLEKERVIVYHTGTTYRQNHNVINSLFNPVVEKSIIALGEFAGMGSINETYIVGAINTDRFKYSNTTNDCYKIAHYPSSSTVKGSDIIERVARKLFKKYSKKFSFKLSTKLVPYSEQIKRISECDIYIELFSPLQNGKPYGSWGITALEAAAMGKVVVTNHTTENIYKKAYGCKTPFIVCNTESELYKKLEELVKMDKKDIIMLKNNTREWVEKYHSYKSSGNKLKVLLGI